MFCLLSNFFERLITCKAKCSDTAICTAACNEYSNFSAYSTIAVKVEIIVQIGDTAAVKWENSEQNDNPLSEIACML